MKTKIESINIVKREPPPKRPLGRKIGPLSENLRKMEVGECLELRGTTAKNYIFTFTSRIARETGRRLTVRKVEGGYDIYRIS